MESRLCKGFKKFKVLKWVLTLGTFYFINFSLNAQHHKIDSLYSVLKIEKEDTNRVKTLNNLSVKLEYASQYGSSDSIARIALQLAQKLGYKKGEAKACINIGVACKDRGMFTEAMTEYNKALEIFEKLGDKFGTAEAYQDIGTVYMRKGNNDEALAMQQKALEIYELLGDKPGQAVSYGDMGIIYKNLGKYPEALKAQLQSLKIAEELNDKPGISATYNNISTIYFSLGNYPEALKTQMKCMKIDTETHFLPGVAADYQNIGNIYLIQRKYAEGLKSQRMALKIDEQLGDLQSVGLDYGNISVAFKTLADFVAKRNADSSRNMLDSAIRYQLISVQIDKQIGDMEGLSAGYTNIGAYLMKAKKLKEARLEFDSALVILKKAGAKDVATEVYHNLSLLDSLQGDFRAAYTAYKNYIAYRDSLKNEEETKKMVREQMQYDFDKQQTKEKAEQDKKDAVAEADKKKQRIISFAIAGGLVLALVFGGFVFRSLRITRKQKEVIEVKNRETEEQKKLIEEKNKDILDSIHYAQRIQKALLASDNLLRQNLPDYFIYFKPKDIVSGDFYWATKHNNRFYLAVCDSTGHGVPGAFMSLLNISYLNEAISERNIMQPNEIFNHARKRLIDNISQDGQQDGMDGILASLYSSEAGTNVDYVAAHNPPIIVRKGEIMELAADKIPVGKSPLDEKSFTHHNVKIEKGDMLYLFTDGYADQFGGPKGKKFKYQQLKDRLLAISGEPMQQQKRILEETLENWKGTLEQVDDVLVIGIRV